MSAGQPAGLQRRLLESPGDIAALAHELRLLGSAGPPVELRLPGLSATESRDLESVVNRRLATCGCGQGRVSGIVTMLVYVGLCLGGVISVAELGIGRTVLLYFLCAGVAMLAAKLTARWRARHSLFALAARLEGAQLPAAQGRGG